MNESLLVVDKPPGPTSFDVVRQIKGFLNGEKVGHSGSLDPFASGVLIILVGRATKLSSLLLNADKRYRATIRLGTGTDTWDRTGVISRTMPLPNLTEQEVLYAVKSYQGTWFQNPPMYSAKKLCGVRLYDLAREQIHVRREPIPVEIYSIELIGFEAPDIFVDVHCSKGTYIRSLAEDLGRRLGCVGHLFNLRRISCGDFSIDDCTRIESIGMNLTEELNRGFQNYLRLLKREIHVRGGDLPLSCRGGKSNA